VAVARRKERLDRLASELSKITEVEIVVSDVTAKDAPERCIGAAMNRFGRLDCLVNNAGSGKYKPVGDTDDATVDEVLDTSLKAPIRFSRAALGVMRSGSSIIHVGSTFGIISGINGGVYSAAKAGLNGLTQAIAADYGAKGIRSNVVAPGVIPTEMTQRNWSTEVFRRKNQEMRPLDRDGTVEDVANVIFFLASREGSYIQGHTIALDGGWTTTKYISAEALNAERVPGSRPAGGT
jgi:3-oxoacyl-[acyl-carrier protein] reductase